MTATKIRQSEFATQHKLLPGEVKALRETHLKEGVDFWSEGRAIFWTEEAVEIVKTAIAPTNPTAFIDHVPGSSDETVFIALPKSHAVSIRITKPARNKRYVYGVLDGEQVSVFVGNNAKRAMNKVVQATVSVEDGATKYTFKP